MTILLKMPISTESQLYVAIPVRGSDEPLLVHQGSITLKTLPEMINRLLVPRLVSSNGKDKEPSTNSVGSLSRRVSSLQQSQHDFARMADIVDGIVNTNGSPIFVVKPPVLSTGDSSGTPPIRLGTWLRQQQLTQQAIATRKSPLSTGYNGKSIDDMLANATKSSDGEIQDPVTQYKVKVCAHP